MLVALTDWEGRVSPLFDSTRSLLIADVKGRTVIAKHYVAFDCDSAFSRAAKLNDLGVNVLICGGISDFYANQIEARGIEIIPFSSGDVGEALEGYLKSLKSKNLCKNDRSGDNTS
jgi:predicted Fe-Mo cluster-binding NifX family protein